MKMTNSDQAQQTSGLSSRPLIYLDGLGCMVFNATFNNISVISWQSLLLVEVTGGPGENHRPVASY
jgi:hypothetical protein